MCVFFILFFYPIFKGAVTTAAMFWLHVSNGTVVSARPNTVSNGHRHYHVDEHSQFNGRGNQTNSVLKGIEMTSRRGSDNLNQCQNTASTNSMVLYNNYGRAEQQCCCGYRSHGSIYS